MNWLLFLFLYLFLILNQGVVYWLVFRETVHRGVGLRSVTAIAEKYGGNAQFQWKDGVFTTRVILNLTNPQKQEGGPQ